MDRTISTSTIEVSQYLQCLCMVSELSDRSVIQDICKHIGSKVNFITTSKTCIDALNQIKSQLIILDYEILGSTCLDLLRKIKNIAPSAAVIVLADKSNFCQAFQTMKLEASYICLKPLEKEKFQEVVRSTLTASINNHNIRIEDLSKTEAQILHLVLKGYSSSEISRELHRSVRTIEGHRYHIMKKLEVENFIGLVKKAFKMGYHDFLED